MFCSILSSEATSTFRFVETFIYLCITFLRPIQGLFNDRIYKIT